MGIFEDFEAADTDRQVFTVEQLNREARRAIEDSLGVVWVEGEISNLARPVSGHLYWTLKDERAQLRCAMFRQRNRQLDFEPRNGQQVLLRGRVSIYEARGEFQLVVDSAEPAGEGILRRRFEALKLKLAAEGLFAEERKKRLPLLPARIGVVTSPTGAAIRDILTVLRRRFPATSVLIYPTPVQGDTAAAEIAETLLLANRRRECDLLILARGGGSLEDLWAFNEEVVARALAALDLPVIVGVGHEVDFTIADFVADQRAPTPSGAAELAVPDRSQWITAMQRIDRQMAAAAIRRLAQRREQWTALARRLERAHPGTRLNQVGQRLDELDARLRRGLTAVFRERRTAIAALSSALRAAAPRVRIGQLRERCQWAGRSLNFAMSERLQAYQTRIAGAARALDAVSPLATLERGYAIASRGDGELIRDVAGLAIGADVSVRIARGAFGAKVTSVEPAEEEPGPADE